MDKIEEIILKKHNGYNCAQAIACSYCDLVGIDEETMYHLTQGFGAGMGNMEGTCGAISGAEVIIGLLNKNGSSTMQDSRQIMSKFKTRNSTTTCKTLKGIETGTVLRSCDDCVRDAVEFLDELIYEKFKDK